MELKPVTLDENKLQELAEKYAIEGAERAIKDYYTRFDSPFVKACEKRLMEMAPSYNFDLPDLTAAINRALSAKIETLCDKIVANTYIEAFNRVFVGWGYEKGIAESQDLYRNYAEYVKDREGDDFDSEQLGIKVRKSSYGFMYIEFSYEGENEFVLSLMENGYDDKGENLYKITSLPNASKWNSGKMPMMSITLKDGARAEMPMSANILDCDFMAFIAKLLLHNVKVRINSYHHWEDKDD
jgi:hypothetical protein